LAYFLGIDVSTTSAKALLIEEVGRVMASASTALMLQTPRPRWSEQNPQELWEGVAVSIRAALEQTGVGRGAVQAIGLTGQMHGLVRLDEKGEVLGPAILWNDQRTGAQCEEIHRRVGRARLIQITGNVALTGFTSPKATFEGQAALST
jgi:xylulokinase